MIIVPTTLPTTAPAITPGPTWEDDAVVGAVDSRPPRQAEVTYHTACALILSIRTDSRRNDGVKSIVCGLRSSVNAGWKQARLPFTLTVTSR
jgi:hypothetical protein